MPRVEEYVAMPSATKVPRVSMTAQRRLRALQTRTPKARTGAPEATVPILGWFVLDNGLLLLWTVIHLWWHFLFSSFLLEYPSCKFLGGDDLTVGVYGRGKA